MNLLNVLSSGAAGIVIGWLVRELVDWFKQKQAHRSDLQKRFFDERLALTLKAMQMMKTSSSALRSMLKLIQEELAAGGNTVDARIMVNTLQGSEAEIKRVAENAAGAVALLRFFHGDKIATRADDAARIAMVPIVQKMTVVLSRMAVHRAAAENHPEDEQEPIFARAVLADADLQTAFLSPWMVSAPFSIWTSTSFSSMPGSSAVMRISSVFSTMPGKLRPGAAVRVRRLDVQIRRYHSPLTRGTTSQERHDMPTVWRGLLAQS